MNEIDVLHRDSFIDKLRRIIQILGKKEKGCCFGIDGAWGSGKTFVLERFEKQIAMDSRFYVIHYNCWKYDYYEEPLMAIIAVLLEIVESNEKAQKEAANIFWGEVKNELVAAAGEVCKNKIGINPLGVLDKTVEGVKKTPDSHDYLSAFRKAVEATRQAISKIAEMKMVIIVVDELDRCLPEYAIKVLERLHHIFEELRNVTVIISMDKKQLEHSIEKIYGGISVDVYLRKFIAFNVSLNKGTAGMYCRKFEDYFSMFRQSEQETREIEEFFAGILQGLDMRTQERIFRKAEIIHQLITNVQKSDCSIMTFEILYLVIILRAGTKNIKWMANLPGTEKVDIGGATFETEDRKEEYSLMLKDYARKGIETQQRFNGVYFVVKDSVIGKTFFWIANVFYEYRNECCGHYYYPLQTDCEISTVRYFVDLIDIIDVD